MAIYLINIALILFWRMYFSRTKIPNARKYYCGVVALQWILISGLRDWSIGTDTYNYNTMFEEAKVTAWRTAFQNIFGYSLQNELGRDPGYTIFTKLFQLFSGSYQLFLIVIAVLFMSLMAAWIYKNSASPCTSFILFSTLFYSFYAITGHRQTIATALVVFLGYELIKQRKFWSFMAVALVAFLIHKSSLAMVPLYFIAKLPVTLGYKFLCAAAVVLIAVLGKRLYRPVARWIGYGEQYIDYAEGGAELYATLLVLLCIVIWLMYPGFKNRRKDAPLLFHINTMTLISGLLVIQNQSFMRIQQYFSLFLMITIPEVINTVKREYRLLVYLLFGAVMIAYLIMQNPQYQFFLMG